MTPLEHLEQVKRDFTYVSDPGKDRWQIGPFKGAFTGDCEEFALTLLLRIAGTESVMFAMLAEGEARIDHVLSDRRNGHAVLWLKDWGYVDSIRQFWREQRLFEHEFTYSSAQIRKKLDGKTVRKPANKGLMIAAIACGALAVYMLTQGF